ncbi:MAG: polysaccharide biosynthesis C-terminal domain-containing protein [Terracidiphilus sp.]
MTNTKTIARNTGWYSLENIITGIVNLSTSIAIARTLGPSKNGYIVYISFIAYLVCNLGGLGIAATARKYMAEFLAIGDQGTARYIYWRTLILQAILATLGTGGILFWINGTSPAEYKLASFFIALSIWPSMVNSISAQANVAAEDFSANFPASALSALTYFIGITVTIVFEWGVVGIGASLLSMRVVDFLVRFFPAAKRALAWKATHVHPPGLRARMIPFAWQSLVTMGVSLIVWNRSEVVLLGKFCADIRQVAFYSVAFSLADQLLQGATIFGSAAGATIFAQYGRDKSRIADLVSTAFRYLALTSIPLHFIAAALAVPALLVIYGHEYAGAAMVVTLAPLLCLPKAFVAPVQNLLESFERQRYVIAATAFASVIDIGVAWYLIRSHGAVGACIGSGVAQTVAVSIMWVFGIHQQKVKLPWLFFAKITFIGVLAALTAHLFVVRMQPLTAILFGGSASLIVLFTLLYWMRVLEPEDHRRFRLLAGILPRPISHFAGTILALLIRSEADGAIRDRSYPLPVERGLVFYKAITMYHRLFSDSIRYSLLSYQDSIKGLALRCKLTSIPVDLCLRGGDSGVKAATYARLIGDPRYASQHISEWPHVKLLQQYDVIGERIWDEGVFEKTEYYKNAVRNIEIFGRYFDAVKPDQIYRGARRYICAYRGLDVNKDCPDIASYVRNPYEHISVYPIKNSEYFQVSEGHHRLAKAYMNGVKKVSGLILRPPVTTPVQDLLLDVLWLKGRTELYQPIDSPEVAQWTLVRRCSDRQAKMLEFMRSEGMMPPVCQSYLDVASSYGWFVDAMSKAGFHAEGVERDPIAISVGTLMYGLKAEQVHRADAVTFLQSIQSKYDVTSCFSLAHHYVMSSMNASAEDLIHLLDSATRYVLFFDTGEGREYPGSRLAKWDVNYIHRWLETNTTFARIVRLGVDEDRISPITNSFGRMLFACVR